MGFVTFKTPDGKLHSFPEAQADAAKRMLENFWLPEEFRNVYPKPLPEGKVRVTRVN